MTQAENRSANGADLELAENLAIVMRQLAPNVPFEDAMQRLEKASERLDNMALYTLGYYIVVGLVEP